MIFNINSTRGQTRFLTCVAWVICLVWHKDASEAEGEYVQHSGMVSRHVDDWDIGNEEMPRKETRFTSIVSCLTRFIKIAIQWTP